MSEFLGIFKSFYELAVLACLNSSRQEPYILANCGVADRNQSYVATCTNEIMAKT